MGNLIFFLRFKSKDGGDHFVQVSHIVNLLALSEGKTKLILTNGFFLEIDGAPQEVMAKINRTFLEAMKQAGGDPVTATVGFTGKETIQ